MAAASITSMAWMLALCCAALMGYAIQRGATCMVAAIDEMLHRRRARRLIALGEAAIWVAGGLILAHLSGGLMMAPSGYPVSAATVAGGAMLGIGALVNRACVFGAIARLGSGEWAYALTPPGFMLGCLIADHAFAMAVPSTTSPALFAGGRLWAMLFALFAFWRGAEAIAALRRREFARHIWSPHRATMVIGIAFVVMLLTVGSWAYTDALASLVRGMTSGTAAKLILFLALLAGAIAGGWTAGRLRSAAPTARDAGRCLCGGVLMGAGTVLIPGGNDGLILVGLPLLQPHALVALVSMALAIMCGMAMERRWAALASDLD